MALPRLLMITTTFPARPGDGTPEFVLTLAQGLTRHFDVTVVAPRVRGARSGVKRMGDVEVRRFAYFPRRWEGLADGAILPNLKNHPWMVVQVPLLVAALFLTTLRTTRRLRPAAINAHWLIPGGLVAAMVAQATGTAVAVTAHGADAYALRSSWARPIKRWAAHRAAAVLPVSADIARLLQEDLGRTGPVIPMGVPVRDRSDLAAISRPQLLFVGRLADKKGADVLLRSLTEIPDARLSIVGSGPEENSLRALSTSLGLDDRVQFAGSLSRAEVQQRMDGRPIVVIPSRAGADGDTDGTPVVLAEAFASGCPVVASAIGGLAEQIEDDVNGLLVSPNDSADLTRAIERLMLRPDDADRLGRAAAESFAGSPLDARTMVAAYRHQLTALAQTS